MHTLFVVCCWSFLIALVIAAIIAILYDLGIFHGDPEKAGRQYDRDNAEAQKRAQDLARLQHEENCNAARDHLKLFYDRHKDLLGDDYPPALMTAFMQTEMAEGMQLSQLWTVCSKKITELLPLVARGKKTEVLIQQIDDDIRACRKRLARLKHSQQDWMDDETEGLRVKLLNLKKQRRTIVALREPR
jgi:hypothetical protein